MYSQSVRLLHTFISCFFAMLSERRKHRISLSLHESLNPTRSISVPTVRKMGRTRFEWGGGIDWRDWIWKELGQTSTSKIRWRGGGKAGAEHRRAYEKNAQFKGERQNSEYFLFYVISFGGLICVSDLKYSSRIWTSSKHTFSSRFVHEPLS